MRFCELCEIFETIFFHHWESASGGRKAGSYLDGMIPFMIPFLLILLMNWLRKCMGNCRLYLEMFWQVACISGNKRANKMYIRIYSVNRNTLSVKSEKWQSVWSTWCFNFFGLSFLNVISERGKMLLLNADAIYFHKKAPS